MLVPSHTSEVYEGVVPVVDSYWPQSFFPHFLLHLVAIQLQQVGPAVLDQDHIVLYSQTVPNR